MGYGMSRGYRRIWRSKQHIIYGGASNRNTLRDASSWEKTSVLTVHQNQEVIG